MAPGAAPSAAPALQVARWFNTPAPITLEQVRGRVVVLHAFQMLCPGCVAHGLPQAQRVHELFSAEQLAVVGLHTVFEHHAVMQFEVLSTNVAAQQLQYIESGRLQALAVGAPARIEALLAVSTLAELGFERANCDSLFGIFAPARTPPAVVQRLNAEINRVLSGERQRAWLRGAYNMPAEGSTEAFAREIAADRRRNRDLVAGNRSQFDRLAAIHGKQHKRAH